MRKKTLNTANLLSSVRLLVIPVYIYCLITDKPNGAGHVIATLIFVAASITDIIDGYVARRYGQSSWVGKLIDPIADRLMCLSAFLCFIVLNKLSMYVVLLIIAKWLIQDKFTEIEHIRCHNHKNTKFDKFSVILQMFLIVVLTSGLGSVLFNNAVIYITVFFTILGLLEDIAHNKNVLREEIE